MEAFDGHEVFFLTWENILSSSLPHQRYLLKNPIEHPVFPLLWAALWGLLSIPFILRILLKERPRVIVSNGSGEVAIPAFYVAKLLGIKTIFIESGTVISTPSIGGKLTYPIADVFLVQWEEALKLYGKKARYEGAII